MIFATLYLSNNLKEKKRNINIDLAVLPSHDTCHVTHIAVKKFISSEEGGCCKVTIPQAGISWDVGTVRNDCGRGWFH